MTSSAADSKHEIPTSAGLMAGGLAALAAFHLAVLIGAVVYGFQFGGPTDADRQAEQAAESLDAQADIGQTIFLQRCASCHGVDGKGGLGPSFDGVTTRYPDLAEQIQVVVDGRNQMPSFGDQLSPEEIVAVVAFERERLDDS